MHYYINVEKEEWKIEVLSNIEKELDIKKVLIYCNTRKSIEDLQKSLNGKNFNV